MKIVIDTNVFVSALITPKSNSARVLELLRDDDWENIVSKEILLEITRVLNYPKIKKRHKLQSLEIKSLVSDYAQMSVVVLPGKRLRLIKDDPSDDKFIECATAGQADFIVSGDIHLLKLKKFGKIKILNPRDFLEKGKFS